MGQRLITWTGVGSLVVLALVAPRWSTAGAATRPSVLHAAASYARSQGFRIGIAVYDTRTNNIYGCLLYTSPSPRD